MLIAIVKHDGSANTFSDLFWAWTKSAVLMTIVYLRRKELKGVLIKADLPPHDDHSFIWLLAVITNLHMIPGGFYG